MISQLPNRIANSKVSAASPTGELLTLGQIYAKVGDYNASFCDSARQSISRKRVTRFNKVAGVQTQRGVISSEDDFLKCHRTNLSKPICQ